MNVRIALLLVAVTLGLTGCANDAATERPRLLAHEEARIGELHWLDARQQVSLTAPGDVNLELTSCWHAPEPPSATPRLVIGEPVCIFGAGSPGQRID